MKSLQFLLSLLVWMQLALAQGQVPDDSALILAVEQLPDCAQECLVTAVSKSSCALNDATCICQNMQLQHQVEICVHKTCTLRQGLMTKNATMTVCHAPIRYRGESVRVSNIIIAVLTAAFGLTRLFYRGFFSGGEFAYDDWCVVAALISGAPSVIIIDRAVVPNGLGRDIWTVHPDQITEFAKYLFGLEVLYFFHIALLKLMLLFFFLRIFPKQSIKRIIWATIVFTCLYAIAFITASIFQCRPISYNWWKWDGEHQGQCININALAWSNAIISIITDIWMLAVPLWEVFQLQLSWRKKLSVAIMFCVGTFVTVISVLRLRSLVTFAASSNPTWDQVDVITWSNLELNIGIMCANLPTLRVILVRLFPKILGTTRATDRAAYYGNGNQSFGMKKEDVALASKGGKSFGSRKGGDPDVITYTTTYEVRHTDSDEQSLVAPDMGRFGQQKPANQSSRTSISSV
ncbi:hypothetical protein COCCADRAFT_30444 [Bipolaris zeicola 26-R-13]|uniref:CFEM domain-containing protein n=1 Tax=Cochliobolus carbonum (strain 26-R-13) TaxID=930089 RepID=W6XSJ5_COCC2|nr:uncharacterized protein COCCADRAFT_30444 [Bipolaris zeicola 26-R-13]EUC28265.1 hypothetical protein COCCADRAFT_30444 [Bipolaris zeicola 26-R-13]